ncbi:MAG: hypothetical protein ACLFV7_05770 [Phycisphaerae bacterium]
MARRRNRPTPMDFSGVMPDLACTSEFLPTRSELAIGAMAQFSGRVWYVNYLSHKAASGAGCGLYEIDEQFHRTRRYEGEGIEGTYANRMVHHESSQLFLGPFVIDLDHHIQVIDELVDVRLASTARHLTDPENKVHVLGMEGEFFEVDVNTLEVTHLADLCTELDLPQGARPHFKAMYTAHGRVIVANNSYDQPDFREDRFAGRLAEWDGREWRILSRAPHYEVYGRQRLGAVVYATGWDRRSAILHACIGSGGDLGTRRQDPSSFHWKRYRLPKGSVNFEHAWQTEWPRIREIEHERYLMDCQGMFYELSPHAWDGHVLGIRPVCTHLWAIPDFLNYRGCLLLGSDQTTPAHGDNILAGESESGVWVGKTDDLWSFGPPAGYGGPWFEDDVEADQPSDPYLFAGFTHQSICLRHDAAGEIDVDVELDATGTGQWCRAVRLSVPPEGLCHSFPPGLQAHWLRLTARSSARWTAQLRQQG